MGEALRTTLPGTAPMSTRTPLRGVLMAADILADGAGFHRLIYKMDTGRGQMSNVTVLISQDAVRKMQAQLARARFPAVDRPLLVKKWALFEITLRYEVDGLLPGTVTITARDL